MRQMADTVKQTGYCVYDSDSGGEEPTTTDLDGVAPENGVRPDVKIITLKEYEEKQKTGNSASGPAASSSSVSKEPEPAAEAENNAGRSEDL